MRECGYISARMIRLSSLFVAAGLTAALLGGCSGPVETRIASTGPGVPDRPVLMWAEDAEGVALPADLGRARAAVEAALTAQGFRFAGEASVAVTLGLSERPASLGLRSGSGADERTLSPAKKRRLFQRCADRTLRLGVALVDRASGRLLYRGAAQEAHCRAGFADATARLARLAVADLAAPGGERVVFTRGRD